MPDRHQNIDSLINRVHARMDEEAGQRSSVELIGDVNAEKFAALIDVHNGEGVSAEVLHLDGRIDEAAREMRRQPSGSTARRDAVRSMMASQTAKAFAGLDALDTDGFTDADLPKPASTAAPKPRERAKGEQAVLAEAVKLFDGGDAA